MEQVLSFPEGLIGLRDARRFVLLPGRPGAPLRRLASLDVPDLSFLVCDPCRLWPGYAAELPGPFVARTVLAIVTLAADAREPTANLMAPLVIDPATGTGRQLVLDTGRYSTRHPLPPPRAA